MFNPFDVTMKNLVERSPSAWLRFVGVYSTDAELLEDEDFSTLDTDLTTVTTTCDKVFRITAPSPFLLHIEFESEGKNVPRRVHRYGVLLDYKYDPPVQSVVDRDDFWTYTYLMMGLRYRREQSINLLKGVVHMTNSTTYMAILEEGEARGRILEGRNLILRQGRKRFGEPSAEIVTQLEAIGSVEALEMLAERLLEAESWQELFA